MHLLNSAKLWNLFRKVLDAVSGMYRIRTSVIREFGVTRGDTIFDVGCGTGQYSQITDAEYYGIDMDQRYIDLAKKMYDSANITFECIRLQDVEPHRQFQSALLVDLTHHITDEDFRGLLDKLRGVVTKSVIIFDPVIQSKRNWFGRFMTSLDRGGHIRSKEQELKFIREYFEIVQVKDLFIFGTESIAVLAKPKR